VDEMTKTHIFSPWWIFWTILPRKHETAHNAKYYPLISAIEGTILPFLHHLRCAAPEYPVETRTGQFRTIV
jgi:hypothetical protein